MHENQSFNTLVQALDSCSLVRSPQLALLSIWGALEDMFSTGRNELRFRVSAVIATFLEPAGEARYALQRKIAKLYDARSSAAHGHVDESHEPFVETYDLAKCIALRIIEDNHVPERQELESRLFLG